MLKQNKQYKQFVWEFSNLIQSKNQIKSPQNIIFLCMGTSKVVGDSIGPSIGTILKKKLKTTNRIKVLGDYENNIHYQNVEKNIEQNIKRQENENSIIVVIDAALSKKENIGKIFVQNEGLKYGEGLKKKSNTIGDISIKAVIGKNTNSKLKNFYELKMASKLMVEFLTDTISNGIVQVITSSLQV